MQKPFSVLWSEPASPVPRRSGRTINFSLADSLDRKR